MKSKDLKNSNELDKTENSELEKSKQPIDSEIQEAVETVTEVDIEKVE